MYFDIFKTTTDYPEKYWWVAKGANHETLCHSEMLSSKLACISTIRVVIGGAPHANVYDETGEVPGDVAARRLLV